MNYQIIINGNQVLNGNIIGIILFTAIIITIIGIIIHYIYKKLTADSLLKYEFITIIAHKFRTPLTSIKWLIEGMVQEETDSYKKQSLDDIKASNQKLIDLTSTMIELTENASSGKASYVFEKLSLNSLVKVTADMLKNSFHEKNIFLNIQYSDHDIIIDADKARMEFVIQQH